MKDKTWVGPADEMGPFGRDERGPRRGHGGGRKERMARGMMRLVLLDGLQSGARHGYEIMKWVEQKTEGAYSPSPGVLYPTLQLLEDEGTVRSDAEGERRTYAITENGLEELRQNHNRLVSFWEKFREESPLPRYRHEVRYLEEDLHAFNRSIWNGLHEALERGDTDLLKQLRHSVQQWRDEARTMIAEADYAASEETETPT